MNAQGTDAWRRDRLGHCTASRFSDVLAAIKSGEAAVRRNYRAELVCERLTNHPTEHFTTAEMRHGTEQEPYARMAYEALTGSVVIEQEFIKHPSIAWCGASPDGYVGVHGGVEIKCPNTAQHIDTLLKGMAGDHIAQVQGNLWISGRSWWDFISFDDRLPTKMRLYVQRVQRDEEYISHLIKEVKAFLASVDGMIEQLQQTATPLRKAA